MSFYRKCERCQQMRWVDYKRQALCNECRKANNARHSEAAIKQLLRNERQFERVNSGPMLDAKLQAMVNRETAMPWERV